MKNAIEIQMSTAPFQIDVSTWQNGYYSVVIFTPNEEQLFKSQTHIKN